MSQAQTKNELQRSFPGLKKSHFKLTSPETGQYNCIAYAAGDMQHWWQPGPQLYPWIYWPPDAEPNMQLSTLSRIFESLGYTVCDNSRLEDGFEKVVMMGAGDEVRHAVRQLQTGAWSSKMGPGVDIRHELSAVCGNRYGEILSIMKRKIAPAK